MGAAAGVLGTLYVWRGGQTLLFLLLAAVLLMACGLLLQLCGPRRIGLERRITPARPVAGDTIRVQVRLHFKSRIPLPWLTITDDWGEGIHQELHFPGFRRTFSYTYELQNLPRGVHHLQGCQVTWGDLAGWFTGSCRLAGEDLIKVLPAPMYGSWAIPEGSVLPGQTGYAKSGRGSSEEALDIRAYAPGDPLNRIHWKSSARRGNLQSRVPEQERGRMICVVLDNCAKSYEIPYTALLPRKQRGEKRPPFEVAVSAAMGQLLSAEQAGAYMQFFTGGWPEGMARHEGLGKLPVRVLDILSEVTPDSERELPQLLEDAASGWIPGMSIAIITGRLTEESAKAIARYLVQGVKMDIYYLWDQPAPKANNTDLDHSARAGSVAASLGRLGARLYGLDTALPVYGHREVEFHASSRKPTTR